MLSGMSRAMTPWSPTVGTVWYSIWAFYACLVYTCTFGWSPWVSGQAARKILQEVPVVPLCISNSKGFLWFSVVFVPNVCVPGTKRHRHLIKKRITPWLALWCLWNVSEEKEPTERPKFSKVAFTPNIHLACPRMSQMYLGFSEISNIIDWMGLQLARAAGVVPQNLKSLQSFQHPEPSRTWCHAVVGQAGVFNQRPGLCNNKIGILWKWNTPAFILESGQKAQHGCREFKTVWTEAAGNTSSLWNVVCCLFWFRFQSAHLFVDRLHHSGGPYILVHLKCLQKHQKRIFHLFILLVIVFGAWYHAKHDMKRAQYHVAAFEVSL